MTESEKNPIDLEVKAGRQEPAAAAAIAPRWHTVVLVVFLVAVSAHSATRFTDAHAPLNRLATYGSSAAMQVGMLVWVVIGLRFKKISLRALLGSFSFNMRAMAADLGCAAVFWIASLMVLGTLGVAWSSIETALAHRTPTPTTAEQKKPAGQALPLDHAQRRALETIVRLAPADAKEIAAWILLCLLVGFVEEIVFRGYLQQQFIAWTRGSVLCGVTLSAIAFGAAHAYEGARGMALLTAFGVLFGMLAIYRRGLRAGMMAHSWHDLITGLALALLRSRHMI